MGLGKSSHIPSLFIHAFIYPLPNFPKRKNELKENKKRKNKADSIQVI